MTQARVRLHLPTHMVADHSLIPSFYRRLLGQLAEAGAETEFVRRVPDNLAEPDPDGHFDFVHNGSGRRDRLLNLGPAYLSRFHYVDPAGVFSQSSVALARFDPSRVPFLPARRFAAQLRRDLVAPRISRYAQSPEHHSFAKGVIAIFLQDVSEPVLHARHMPAAKMVQTVLGHRRGMPVMVKPHPNNIGQETSDILEELLSRHPDVVITTANVHDILASAAVTVSIGSGVAVEGMMHRVPAVLFGQSDLHHCATTVRHPQDWPSALDLALSHDWPFDAFLLWFLRWQNVWASRPFLSKVLTRMESAGARLAALGLHPPGPESPEY